MSHLDSRSDPIGGSELNSGCETIYWDSLPFFFSKSNLYLWVWPTSYNRIKYRVQNKNYHRSGVYSIYTHALSPIYIYKTVILHLQLHYSERRTYCDEPLLVCWPSCMRMFSDSFSCTYTDEKPVLSFTLSGKHM